MHERAVRMNKKISVIALVVFMLVSHIMSARNWQHDLRIGYSIGGIAPVGLPASIRGVNSYSIMPDFGIGVETKRLYSDHWGIITGLRFENKAMKVDARVKNYHMKMVQGTETLEGMFTGDDETKVNMWMFTIPVQALYRIGKVDLKAGPYLSWVVGRQFKGYAHDGYIRVGNPTGAKVEIGSEPDNRGTYDFSDNLRQLQWGAIVGADWKFSKRVGAYADLTWGLNGVFHKNFTVIDQTMYPIYGTLGLVYSL